jgi:hypothetical protein
MVMNIIRGLRSVLHVQSVIGHLVCPFRTDDWPVLRPVSTRDNSNTCNHIVMPSGIRTRYPMLTVNVVEPVATGYYCLVYEVAS